MEGVAMMADTGQPAVDSHAAHVDTVTTTKPPKGRKSSRAKHSKGKSPNGLRKTDTAATDGVQRKNSTSKRFDETAYMKWLTPLGSDTKDYWSEYQSKYGTDQPSNGVGAKKSEAGISRLDRLLQTGLESQTVDLTLLDYSRHQDAQSTENVSQNGDGMSNNKGSSRSSRSYKSMDDNALPLRRSMDFSDLNSGAWGDNSPPEGNTQQASKYQRNRSKNPTRRSTSDLGYLTSTRNQMPHAPRTAALLSNPAFRKHLARSVGQDPDNVDLVDSVDKKFQKHLTCLNAKRQPGAEDADGDGGQESNKLRPSASDSLLAQADGVDSEEDVFQPMSNGATSQTQGVDLNMTFPMSFGNSKKHVSSGDLEAYASQSIVPPLDLGFLRGDLEPGDGKPPMAPGNSFNNKFHIPTFGEFRRLRKSGHVRPSSFSCDFSSVDTIQEEVDLDKSTRVKSSHEGNEDKRSNNLSGASAGANSSSNKSRHSSHRKKSANSEGQLEKPVVPSRRTSRSKKMNDNSSPPDETVIDLTAWDFSVNMTSDQSAKVKVKDNAKVRESPTTRAQCDSQANCDTDKTEIVQSGDMGNRHSTSVEDAGSAPVPKPRRKSRPGVARIKQLAAVSDVSNGETPELHKRVPGDDGRKCSVENGTSGEVPHFKKTTCYSSPRERLLQERKRKCSGTATKEQILTFLQGVKSSGLETSGLCVDTGGHSRTPSLLSLDSCAEVSSERHRTTRKKNNRSNHGNHGNRHGRKRKDGSSGIDVQRVDSGVGSETTSQKHTQGPACEDCEQSLQDLDLPEGATLEDAIMCRRCELRRAERKDTIQEIVNTEISYGKDLKIIKEEFYMPMKTAGLVNAEQLQTIFNNLEELTSISSHFTDQLQDALDMANEQGDEDFMTVHVGKLFLQSSNMLLAFETYCVNQSAAPSLLDQLEKEKELLRIFLNVSQADNSVLRRMSLKSFLVIPVQRIMKYPLLLTRLYKLTPYYHEDRDNVRKAQLKIEDILDLINAKAKDSMVLGMRKKFISRTSQRLPTAACENIELNKVAMETLGWNRNDINFLRTGRMLFTQPSDHLWAKKSKSLKFQTVHLVLATLGKSSTRDAGSEPSSDRLHFYKSDSGIKEGALIIVKEKAGKYVPFRDPLLLSKCVVAVDPVCSDIVEVLDLNKESFLFKGEVEGDTESWCRLLKLQAKDLGGWRRRRNAFANIMIQNMAKS